MKLRKNTIALAAAACTLLITNAAQGAVVVTFAQVGADVVATWDGSLNPGVFAYQFLFGGIGAGLGDRLYVTSDPTLLDVYNGGSHTTTSLSRSPDSHSSLGFGFESSRFYFKGSSGSQAPSLVTLSPGTHTMTWRGMTLASIGASNFNNTLAWTSSAGGTNTISYTTVVPEPSAALLSGLGMLCLLRRRK